MLWKTEGAFSNTKRISGEEVCVTFWGMFREIQTEVNGYNMLMAMVA